MMAIARFEGVCNKHNALERIGIKIIQRYNMDSGEIKIIKTKSRPTVGEIKYIEIGRNVNFNDALEEAKSHVEKYLRDVRYLGMSYIK